MSCFYNNEIEEIAASLCPICNERQVIKSAGLTTITVTCGCGEKELDLEPPGMREEEVRY